MCFIPLILIILPGLAIAQSTVTGTVSDETSGTPMPGVNIVIQGTSAGTITDINGKFSIEVDNPNAVLLFSFVGYLSESYPLDGATVVTMTLVEDILALEELVVIGYGTQKKQDLTGAVSVVKMEDYQKIENANIAKKLQGQVAGMQVTGSGEPGSIPQVKIRGVGSFGNNEPLYVIDGVPIANATQINAGQFTTALTPSGGISDLNPADIESIQVLKDASASAIYGARGANGVIIITTKRGRSGKLKVEYNGSYGWQNVTQRLDVANREQFQEINNIARTNDGVFLAPANDPTDPYFIDDIDTDWQEEVFTTGHITDHVISFQGGSEGSTYYASLNYFDQTGTMVGPGPRYNRYSAKLNMDQERGIFRFGQSFTYTNSDQIRLTNTQWDNSIGETVIGIPTVPVYDVNNTGGYGGGNDTIHDAIAGNQVAFNNIKTNTVKRYRFVGVVYAEAEIIDGFRYKINLSYDRSDYFIHEFLPIYNVGTRHRNDIAFLNQWRGENPYMLMENTFAYDKVFGKHTLNTVIGHTVQYDYWQDEYGHAEGYTEPYKEVLSAGPDNQAALGTKNEHRLLSYLGRVNYGYDDRYLLTVNFRRDYSSRFGPNNKFGDFPSLALAWKVHNESFFNVDFINVLKFRGGIGKIGNEQIGDYRYESYINIASSYPFGTGGQTLLPAGTQVNIIDPSIKWEERVTRNIGIDLAFMNNKLEFTAEYYSNEARDILYDLPVPRSTGTVLNPTVNTATMTNKGLEFVVNYRKYEGEFHWSAGINLTTLKNEVTRLGANNDPVITYMSRTEVGRSMGDLYGWDMEGIFQNEEDIAEHAFQAAGTRPGDIMFRDVNGRDADGNLTGEPDGVINDDDRVFHGKAFPSVTGGMNLTLEYKGLDFSLFLQGSYGNTIWNGTYNRINLLTDGNYSVESYENYWRGENTSTTFPRPTRRDPNGNNRTSQRWFQDGSYLRIQNVQLGYSLPGSVVNKIPGVEGFRFYVSLQNALTFTKYKGFDPDIINDGLFFRGQDNGSYPNPRTFLLGVKLSL